MKSKFKTFASMKDLQIEFDKQNSYVKVEVIDLNVSFLTDNHHSEAKARHRANRQKAVATIFWCDGFVCVDPLNARCKTRFALHHIFMTISETPC